MRDMIAITIVARTARAWEKLRNGLTTAVVFALCTVSHVTHAHAVSDNVKNACRNDYFQHCSQYAVGSDELRQCMRGVGENLSTPCLVALVQEGEITKEDVDRHNAAKSAGTSKKKPQNVASKEMSDPKDVSAKPDNAEKTANKKKSKTPAIGSEGPGTAKTGAAGTKSSAKGTKTKKADKGAAGGATAKKSEKTTSKKVTGKSAGTSKSNAEKATDPAPAKSKKNPGPTSAAAGNKKNAGNAGSAANGKKKNTGTAASAATGTKKNTGTAASTANGNKKNAGTAASATTGNKKNAGTAGKTTKSAKKKTAKAESQKALDAKTP